MKEIEDIAEKYGHTKRNPTSIGWVCPSCGKANAPWKGSCDCRPSYVLHRDVGNMGCDAICATIYYG